MNHFFFLTLQKRSSEKLRNLLKANSNDTQDIQNELHTEVMDSENRNSQHIAELVYILMVFAVSC